jgi:hypothetical protein
MDAVILELSKQESMRVEAILMDDDAEESLTFIKEVIRPKLRAKGSTSLDAQKSTGIMT